MALVSRIVGFSVVSVRSGLAQVRRMFGGLGSWGVTTGARSFWSERLDSSRDVLLLLVLFLETRDKSVLVTPTAHPGTLLAAYLFFMRPLLLGHFVQLVKLLGAELCELGHKDPEVPDRKEETQFEHEA